MALEAILAVEDVSFQYPNAPAPSLKQVSMTAHRGDRILLIGHNGSGKSTLLSLLAGRRKPQLGRVRVLGRDPFDDTSMAQQISMIGAPWPPEAVFGNTVDRVASPAPIPERKRNIADALHLRLSRFVEKMSWGEKRRTQILHGMLYPATVYLLDECSTDIDVAERRTVLELVRQECEAKDGCCVYATHILDGLEGWATHLLLMEGGRVVAFTEVEKLTMSMEDYALQFMSKPGYSAHGVDPVVPPSLRHGVFTAIPATSSPCSIVASATSPATVTADATVTYWMQGKKESQKSELVINCAHLTYKDVFQNLSFQVFRGERVLLCGGNGTGKSTLLNMLGGKQFFNNDNGALSVLGKRCYDDMLLNALVSYGGDWWTAVPGGEVHVRQMLQLRTSRAERLREMLAVDMDWDVRHISAGEQKRVQLLLHLLDDKPVVLLDEATTDLDVHQRHNLLKFMYEESVQRGVTIVYSTHIFGGLEGWANVVVLLDRTVRGAHAVWRASEGQPISLQRVVDEIVALKTREIF
ncbi:abc transporter, putative [Leishmania tarentolae]|uniref:Abc transporter, putative n=1 Tax=Leishmania tarentolae TaxID=5689 RepID=A0A640KN17_LEITA|nr:abc transporter, putative [Leishmania tarentolae]